MGKYKRIPINPRVSYLILCKLIGYSARLEGLNRTKGLEKWTDLGIARVHTRDLFKRGIVTSTQLLGCMLTEKGLIYYENSEQNIK